MQSGKLMSVPPVGGRIPENTIHAVSVSLPRVRDVIGYEEKRSETMSQIKSGYPRFVAHPYVTEIVSYFQKKSSSERPCVLVSSEKAALELFSWSGYQGQPHMMEEDGLVAFPLPENSELAAHLLSFIQHTGCLVSSRRAEDFLLSRGLIAEKQQEQKSEANPEDSIREELARLNGVSPQSVALSVSGMNAIYASFRCLQLFQESQGKTIWIQLGWLYVDNIRIIEKFTSRSHRIYQMDSTAEVEQFLLDHRGEVAGIITEVPTNPLLQTPDLERLYKICKQEDCALIADISVGSSACLEVLPHCDVAVESLTKFASGSCDVMMGAAIINKDSPFASQLKQSMKKFLEEPYVADLARMAYRIQDYESRMLRIAQNVRTLYAEWKSSPFVASLFRPDEGPCAENYRKLARSDAQGILPGGMLTMVLSCPMEPVYDSLSVLKGPSFGTDFTLVMLYLYLAHYELVS
ncbi:MAG: PLP-dependent transferase, partial [Leptospiraceae bacterium]|nr:PLP-dependent transferase [Leptospiraceae bacterium]